ASPIAHRPNCWSRTRKNKTPSSRVSQVTTRDDFSGTGIQKSLCIESHNYHFVNISMKLTP
ncbi:hypothetical protein LI168_16625, partial [Desulfovibrio desulfuricans]|uniref:hypothetical protein n=1 Tax=Desulfovibrio desulfuricans TaxID=876 RepID=UPI001D065809